MCGPGNRLSLSIATVYDKKNSYPAGSVAMINGRRCRALSDIGAGEPLNMNKWKYESVEEVIHSSGSVIEYATRADFPTVGEAGKIYIDKSTNTAYRWNGTTYAPFSESIAQYPTRSAFPTVGQTGILYVATDTGLCYRWTGASYEQFGSSVCECLNRASFPTIGEGSKIYIDASANLIYRWDTATSQYYKLTIADFSTLTDLPEDFSEAELRTKLNTMIHMLKGIPCIAAALLCLSSFSATVYTARKDTIRSTAPVVTNVTFEGLAPTNYVDAKVLAEKTRALAAEQAVASAATNYTDSASNAVYTALNARLVSETNRAQQAEWLISKSATNYTDAATNALYGTIATDVTNLTARLVAETNRAQIAEKALDTRLIAETNRAQTAERSLNTKLIAETNRAQQAEIAIAKAATNFTAWAANASTNYTDSATNALYGTIATDITNLTARLVAETNRAQVAEKALDTRLVAETNRAQVAEKSLKNLIIAETNRAQNAEYAVAVASTNYTDTATNALYGTIATDLTNLTARIVAETNRAQVAEKALSDRIVAETNRAQVAEKDLKDLLVAETNRAQIAEHGLDTRLIAETNRAQIAEKDLNDRLVAETNRAQVAENVLRNLIYAETNRAYIAETNLMAVKQDKLADYTTTNAVKDLVQLASITNAGAYNASKKYTDDAVIAAGHVTPPIVTNITEYVIATNNFVHKDVTNVLSGVVSALNTRLVSETNRAQVAEKALDTRLIAETNRAQVAEKALSDRLVAETNRAQVAETALKDLIIAETNRAQVAEKALDDRLVAETNRAQNAEYAVAKAATNYTDTISSAVANSATNYTDTCCRTLAVSATNYTDFVAATLTSNYVRSASIETNTLQLISYENGVAKTNYFKGGTLTHKDITNIAEYVVSTNGFITAPIATNIAEYIVSTNGFTTTNDVCNIVTNNVNGGAWVTNITAVSAGKPVTLLEVSWSDTADPQQWKMRIDVPGMGETWDSCAAPNNTDPNARTLASENYPELVTTRGLNALGLAYYTDIPTNYVAKATTNDTTLTLTDAQGNVITFQGGSLSYQDATNIAEYVVSTNNFDKKIIDATNNISKIQLNGTTIWGDRKVEYNTDWSPESYEIPDTDPPTRWAIINWKPARNSWYCAYQQFNGTSWVNRGGGDMSGSQASDPNATELYFPGTTVVTRRYVYETTEDKLATTGEVAVVKRDLQLAIAAVASNYVKSASIETNTLELVSYEKGEVKTNYFKGGSVDYATVTNIAKDTAFDYVAKSNVNAFTDVATNSIIGKLNNRAVSIQVIGDRFSLLNHGTNIWSFATNAVSGAGITDVKVNGVSLPQTSGSVNIEIAYNYTLGTLADGGTLSTSEIRNITTSADFSLTLAMGSSATESADCSLWVNASAAAADVTITSIGGGYTISGESGYNTITAGKKALITFTRITATDVIVMKKEF